MKSIIFEAPSIAKAVEQSWKKAGKPQQFSVKILEEEEKNFLGMTKKPAKIAIFFDEATITQKTKDTTPKSKKVKREQKPEIKTKKTARRSNWNMQMTTIAKKWTGDMLNLMNLSHIKFSTTTTNNNIRFHFKAPLLKNEREQKILFSNFAFLLMQTLRYKFKKPFRNLKVVFTSN